MRAATATRQAGRAGRNAALAGLAREYIAQQVMDFKNGLRRAAWPGPYAPADLMIHAAKTVTAEEVDSAAEYFSQQVLRPRVEVVENARVPRTEVVGLVYVRSSEGGDEPLGERLMEIAPSGAGHENRDDQMRYTAYVPPGSIARGREIARSGGGQLTVACITCHGPKLQGLGAIPPIAGRSPTYLLRQLLAFQNGARSGPGSQPMQPVVMRMKIGSMIDVTAYAASLPP